MDPETGVSALSTIITSIGTVVTGAIGWCEDILESVMTSGNELMLLAFLIPFVGLGIGFLKRLTR